MLSFIRGYKLTQFYGYSKEGDKPGVRYDDDLKSHTYFISSQETAFELAMLQKFDAELFIGQISYKQKADIYNVYNGYDTAKKERERNKKQQSGRTAKKLSDSTAEESKSSQKCSDGTAEESEAGQKHPGDYSVQVPESVVDEELSRYSSVVLKYTTCQYHNCTLCFSIAA